MPTAARFTSLKSSNLISYLQMAFMAICLSASGAQAATGFEDWLKAQSLISLTRMNDNISPVGTVPGTVIASPQRQDPDYYFHWIRDSALVLDAVLIYKDSPKYAPIWKKTLTDFVNFSKQLQVTASLTGLGEPRYNTDGTPFNGPWARPQNDGPALRIIALYNALIILDQEPPSSERAYLQSSIASIIHIDLKYILTHWQSPCYDLWEEVRGQHFYTSLAQLAAFEKSLTRAELTLPETYSVRDLLRLELDKYWKANKGYFAATRDRLDGAEGYKFTDLDTAIVLGVLHAQRDGEAFSVRDERVLSTALKLEKKFAAIYVVNADINQAPAIGRYEDDVYFGGNPWYITTAAFSELLYKLANSIESNPDFVITSINVDFFENILKAKIMVGTNLQTDAILKRQTVSALRTRGDQFLEKFHVYTPVGGGLAEQFERADGRPMSARDLTWSYAAFLTALKFR